MRTTVKQKENEELMMKLAKNIRKYRKLRNITQEELADKMEISREYLRRFETKFGKEGLSFINI